MLQKVDITKIQADALRNAQFARNEAHQRFEDATRQLELVTTLVLDAHNLDPTIHKIDVDLKNLQMIVEVPDVSIDNDPPVSALEKIRNRSTEILENEIG